MKCFLMLAVSAMAFPVMAFAQDNAACDRACGVPCYFGSCAPAVTKYKDALANCSVDDLDLVSRLYRGTDAAIKASAAAQALKSHGIGRISATSNSSSHGQNCTALVGETPTRPAPTQNLCDLVDVPAGWQCISVGGRVQLIPSQQPAPSSLTSITGLSGPENLGNLDNKALELKAVIDTAEKPSHAWVFSLNSTCIFTTESRRDGVRHKVSLKRSTGTVVFEQRNAWGIWLPESHNLLPGQYTFEVSFLEPAVAEFYRTISVKC